jgi:hypothetical protein
MPSSAWASIGHAPSPGWSVPTRPLSAKNRRYWLLQMAVNPSARVLGWEDDVWWSRAAQPQRPAASQMWWRCARGRPVSGVTGALLAWLATSCTAQAKRARLLSWDQAPWHVSQTVQTWSTAPHRHARQEGAVVSWSVGSRARVPSSSRLRLRGAMANRPSWSPRVCSPRWHSYRGSVPMLRVH